MTFICTDDTAMPRKRTKFLYSKNKNFGFVSLKKTLLDFKSAAVLSVPIKLEY